MYFEIKVLRNQEYVKVAHTVGLRMQEAEIDAKTHSNSILFELENLWKPPYRYLYVPMKSKKRESSDVRIVQKREKLKLRIHAQSEIFILLFPANLRQVLS